MQLIDPSIDLACADGPIVGTCLGVHTGGRLMAMMRGRKNVAAAGPGPGISMRWPCHVRKHGVYDDR
jgi:hypothetical protein